MDELDLEGLEKVARAAADTAPWRYEQYHRVWDREGDPVCKPYGKTFGQQDAYGEHIATFDPPTVLALLSELNTARAERDEAYLSGLETGRMEARIAEAELASARAKLGEVEAERDDLNNRIIPGLNKQLTEQFELSSKYVGASASLAALKEENERLTRERDKLRRLLSTPTGDA